MHRLLLCLILSCLSFGLSAKGAEPRKDPAPSGPSLTLPAEVKARPGHLVLIQAKTEAKIVRWVSLSEDADLLPYLDQSAIFSAPAPGRYRVLAYTAAADVPSLPTITTVIVAGPAPPPPPGPEPGPADPFGQALKAAYAAETDQVKAQEVGLLAALYRNAGASTVRQQDIKTLADLHQVLKTAAASLMAADALPRVRRVLADELNRVLGTNASTPLDEALRKKAAEQMLRLANALQALL